MKIKSIETILLKKELSSTMCISRGGFKVRNHLLVKVTTDDGITGLGEGVGNARYVKALIDGPMKDLAIGEDPFQIEKLRRKLLDQQVYYERMGSAICAASAIEMALWDIKGKALNVPVYELLGGLANENLETYVSDVYWDEDVRGIEKETRRIMDMGFRTVKAHLGFKGPREDVRRVEVLRETLGPKLGLMIDLNCGYQHSDALRAAQMWDKYDLLWLEEPLSPNLTARMGDLRARTQVPIAAGENEFQIHGFKKLFDDGAVDIAMPDIARVGGIQETKNVCVLAEAYGIEVSPHNFSSGVLLAATMHILASTPNASLLEYDSSENSVYHELLISPLEIKNGVIKMPRHAGLGVELRAETIKKYAI
jgi:D-galactarolactone cycloisomerase